ncbi:hypothetical protein [uncultured Moraxella sp.]|nr:hypothetical protein [uncultured Moraxella sp.]
MALGQVIQPLPIIGNGGHFDRRYYTAGYLVMAGGAGDWWCYRLSW